MLYRIFKVRVILCNVLRISYAYNEHIQFSTLILSRFCRVTKIIYILMKSNIDIEINFWQSVTFADHVLAIAHVFSVQSQYVPPV